MEIHGNTWKYMETIRLTLKIETQATKVTRVVLLVAPIESQV